VCGGMRVLPCCATLATPGAERTRRRGCASMSVCSFACGLDEGVRAVLDSNAVPHLLRTLTNNDEKVVEAGARSLKQILNVRPTLIERSMRDAVMLRKTESRLSWRQSRMRLSASRVVRYLPKPLVCCEMLSSQGWGRGAWRT
jgi:hypothetical protein